MAKRASGRLTVAGLRALRHDGKSANPMRFPDGARLYVQVTPGNSRLWVFRYSHGGKERWMGLGRVALNDADAEAGGLTLAEAREARNKAAEILRKGIDPLAAREATSAPEIAPEGVTFEAAALATYEARRGGWRNAKHGAQWIESLRKFAFPIIGQKPVSVISTEDVLRVLKGPWAKTPETASRLRQRMEVILDFSAVKKWRPEDSANPARWRGHLAVMLPKPSAVKPPEHFPSLPWREVSGFMAALRSKEGMAARALAFVILTASRTGAVRKMKWAEIDWQNRIWAAPRSSMKGGKFHRTPLSEAAIAILESMKPLADGRDSLVFPARDRKGNPAPLSDMSLTMSIRGMCFDGASPNDPPRWRDIEGRPVTAHGFRSTFKDWTLEASFPDHLSEIALAHSDKSKTRKAYARDDLLEPRRAMMERWGEIATNGPASLVKLAEHRAARLADGA